MTNQERADIMDACNELSISIDGVKVVPLDDLMFYLEEITASLSSRLKGIHKSNRGTK